MNVLVCISRVPDTTSKINFTDGNTRFNEEGVTWIMNPTDEWYALVRAIEVKEQLGGTVTVVHVGTAASDTIIRKALAIGADSAVRIDAEAPDALFAGAQIATYAKDKNFDIIITGKETINYNGSILGGVIAEHLDQAYISLATKMTIDGPTATIEREIEGGTEVVEVQTPFVMSANKGLAEQRIPNMRGIMMARKKPLEVVAADASITAGTVVVKFDTPAARTDVKLVDADNVEELIRLLREEAKAI
ncbi:electron transfer flavoprotein subunit beta/FixA family protein [Chitinophagales bacterium]|nr:electron transfer flavoprotein subunit beta/FixA family protein [Chitinophagales bacterium]